MSGLPNSYSPQSVPPPPVIQPQSGRSTTSVLIIGLVVAIVTLFLCSGVLVALLLPAVQAAREAARRMSCSNNVKQIALALHNYHSVNGSLPPAYTVDENGQPLHSWRTLILPYMEYGWLYDQIDLSKPWDDPVNIRFSEMPIPTFSCPSTSINGTALTCYQLIDDPRAIMYRSEDRRFSEVSDGLADTLMIVECSEEDAVPWMKPQDLPASRFLNPVGSPNHSGGANAAFGDGSVRFLSESLDSQAREALLTRDGADIVPTTLD